MRGLLILCFFCCTGCSIKKFYPAAGAVIGGGTGAIGGPVTAAAGAGTGWAVGELAKGEVDLKEAQEKIEALTAGDVEKLVQLEMESNGYFDSMIDGVYDFIKLCAVGLAAWLAFQFWLNHKLAKKAIKDKDNEST